MRKLFVLLILALTSFISTANSEVFNELSKRVDSAPFIVVDKQQLVLYLVDADGNQIKEYGVACAKNYGNKEKRGDCKTPEGVFKICQVLNSVDLLHDFGDGKGEIRGAYGPWFLRLDVPGFNDIAIHGTHLPESIGTRATEGCIRLKNEDVVDLKGRIKVGTPVIILPDADCNDSTDSLSVSSNCEPQNARQTSIDIDSSVIDKPNIWIWLLSLVGIICSTSLFIFWKKIVR